MKASICTFTGREFFPLAPRVEDVDIYDIAHALSCMPRFAGHTRHFYSVAQHCLLVASLVPKDMALAGLLHDAAEAYLMDLPTPIKRLMPAYCRAEAKLLGVIGDAFRQRRGWAEDVAIKQADRAALQIEHWNLMPTVAWWQKAPPPEGQLQILRPMSPAEAEGAFLEQFYYLDALRALRAGGLQ